MQITQEQIDALKKFGYHWREDVREFWHEDHDDKNAILPFTYQQEWQLRSQGWTNDEWEWDYETFS